MKLLAIDPGSDRSAAIVFDVDARTIVQKIIGDNATILESIDRWALDCDHLAVEMVASYGMAVGSEVFDTCVWIGRFVERWRKPYTLVYRREVKLLLCNTVTARDANVRQALIDQFGPGKAAAIGTKKSPGPLYGMRKDLWAALAVAVAWASNDRRRHVPPENVSGISQRSKTRTSR